MHLHFAKSNFDHSLHRMITVKANFNKAWKRNHEGNNRPLYHPQHAQRPSVKSGIGVFMSLGAAVFFPFRLLVMILHSRIELVN